MVSCEIILLNSVQSLPSRHFPESTSVSVLFKCNECPILFSSNAPLFSRRLNSTILRPVRDA